MRVALVAWFVIVVPTVALAQPAGSRPAPPPTADQLATEADALATAGDFPGAAAKFRAAYAIDQRADLLCNVGVAYYKAKDLPRAHFYLGRCLTSAGALDAGFVTSVRNVFAAVEDKLRAGDFAPVQITVKPDGARVVVSAFGADEPIIGTLVWLPFGHHTATVTAEGHVDKDAAIEVENRTEVVVRVELDRAPVTGVGSGTGGVGDTTVAGPPRSRRPALIATIATGAIGGGAIVVYMLARSKATSAGDAGLDLDQYNHRVDAAKLRQKVSWVLAGVAGAGAVVSGYLWYRATRSPTRLEIAPASDGAAVSITGSF